MVRNADKQTRTHTHPTIFHRRNRRRSRESPRNYARMRRAYQAPAGNFAPARRRVCNERAGVQASVLLSGRCLRRFQLAKARLPPTLGRSIDAFLRHATVPPADLKIDRVCCRRRRRRTTPVLGLPPRGASDPFLLAFTPVYRDYPAAALSSCRSIARFWSEL